MIKIGEKYNLLTVTRVYKENNKTVYECKCDCGNNKNVIGAYKLYRGSVKSCGCLTGIKCADRNRKNRIYNLQDSRLLDIWRHMHYRCEKANNISYKYYGAKGVKVCNEWSSFDAFAAWSHQNGYKDNLTIDRIDCSKSHEPNNCRWVSSKIQNNNSSHCHCLTYNGVTASISKWSEMVGLPYSTIKSRINKLHWSAEEALTIPYFCKKEKI